MGGGALALRASVERDPVVRITSVSGSTLPCTGFDPLVVVVSVTDQSPIQSVTLVWSGPGAPGSSNMSGSGTSWTGQVTPAAVGGVWNWEAVATDARGNTGRVASTVTVVGC